MLKNVKNKYSHYVKFDGKEYERCSEITTYSNDDLLMEFKSIIEPLYTKDSLDNHLKLTHKILPSDGTNRYLEKHPNMGWYVLQIPRIRGSKDTSRPEHLTFFTKEMGKNIVRYNEFDDNTPKLYLTDKNIYNISKYLHGFFARICLIYKKQSITLGKGELKLVPWFDFSDPIFDGTPEEIDMTLFKKYNISQEIIDHILEILPNYYDLDLTKYKG